MPSFPAFVIKIKINVSANLTYFVCQFSTNFNFNFNFKSWETGSAIFNRLIKINSRIKIYMVATIMSQIFDQIFFEASLKLFLRQGF